MSIEETTQYSSNLFCDVRVEVGAESLNLSEGTVRAGGATYQLVTTDVKLNRFDTACTVRVFLVKRKDADALSVLVDECAHDGVDRPYSFAGSPFEPIHVLAMGVLPAKCKDATQGTWRVYRVEPSPVEASSPPVPQPVSAAQLQELLKQRGIPS